MKIANNLNLEFQWLKSSVFSEWGMIYRVRSHLDDNISVVDIRYLERLILQFSITKPILREEGRNFRAN